MPDVWHITELQIERFKAAFRPAPLRLRPFDVVIGRNGSGKSTLLEALQWLDTTIRHDARQACDRYQGIQDLMNLRSRVDPPYFRLTLTWGAGSDWPSAARYRVRIADRRGLPVIAEEHLQDLMAHDVLIETRKQDERTIVGPDITVVDSDRLALGTATTARLPSRSRALDVLAGFWSRAVFLRLSPNRLAAGSPSTRKSFEPLLDEEGQTLPALLNDLSDDRRQELVEAMREILSGIQGVQVSEAEFGRDTRVHYSLLERMPYRGRSGRRQFPIPAWMLSEGTRRITALLALIHHDPPPSLLCIEEIENGLDPWTVRAILRHLQSAADDGTQVLLTTHSPWVLDEVPLDSIVLVRRVEGDTRYERFLDVPEVAEFSDSIPAGTRYANLEHV